jgi:hypothetical protein
MFADKDTGHPYRALSTALIDEAPMALCPRNAALKVNVEVVGHQPKTVTGHGRDGLGGLPAGLPLNAVGGHMSSLRTVGERVEHPPHVAQFLGIEHLVDNREDAPLFPGYSHGGHPLRLPSSVVSSPCRAPGNGSSVTPGGLPSQARILAASSSAATAEHGPGVRTLAPGVSSRGRRPLTVHQKVPGANLGAIRANDFPRQANGSGQTTSDHVSLQTDPDSTERQTGIYGSDARRP